ncbi:MAG TPA: hypothetical protein VF691_04230 [Cytophagaceae bacterium]|jgi:hypothetical protein
MEILKEPKSKLFLYGGIAVIAMCLVWYFFIRKTKTLLPPNPQALPESSKDEEVFPLKKGKQGKEIEQLQTFLLTKYGAQFPKWGIDGNWGEETETNVIKFLKKDTVSKIYFEKAGIGRYKTNKYK